MNIKTVFSNITKVIWLIFLPFAFPTRFIKLFYTSFTNPRLMGELIHLYKTKEWIHSKNFATVIDAGAFIGSYSFGMAFLLPRTKIIAFEPLPENFYSAKNNLSFHKKFTIYDFALGNSEEDIDFYSNQFKPSSSLLELDDLSKKIWPFAAKSSKITVHLSKLDRFIDSMNIESPAILKIDVQGFELEVLRGATECLKLIDSVYLEVSFKPLYKNQCDFDSIHKLLTDNKFEFEGCFEPSYAIDGSLIQCDVLYCKKHS